MLSWYRLYPHRAKLPIDAVRHILYVPTTQTQSNGQADVAKVTTYAEFGASAVRTATTTPTTVSFTFKRFGDSEHYLYRRSWREHA